ncbi:MAG: hypothetical protein H6839_06730 [Planctomycetes bacterium]|nr:hypothetical protein [Planctomycetota bacterium]
MNSMHRCIVLCAALALLSACATTGHDGPNPEWPSNAEAGLKCRTIRELQVFIRERGEVGECTTDGSRFVALLDSEAKYVGEYHDADGTCFIDEIHLERRRTLEERLPSELYIAQMELLRRVQRIGFRTDAVVFDLRALLDAANYAIQNCDRMSVVHALGDYVKACEYRDGEPGDPAYYTFAAALVARLVFVPIAGAEVELPAVMPSWSFIPLTHLLHQLGCPLYPIVLQDGIPFVLWYPGNGMQYVSDEYIQYCRNWCELRTEPFAPSDDPLGAAEKLIARFEGLSATDGAEMEWSGFDFEAIAPAVRGQAVIAVGAAESAGVCRNFAQRPHWDYEGVQWKAVQAELKGKAFGWDADSSRWVSK